MTTVILENGADVILKNEVQMRHYDRIEMTDPGMIVCINKQTYSKDIFPREVIESMHTHTTDEEENAEWW